MAEVKKKLGDMLKEAGIIDDFQLQTALSHQRNWGGKLGAVLIDLHFVQEGQLAGVIADKLHIPYVNLFEPEIPQAIVKLIKPEIAKKFHVMPVKKEGGSLVLAMLDPLDIEAMDEVRFITGFTIKPSLALESEIKDAVKKYYDGEDIIRKQEVVAHAFGRTMEVVHGGDLHLQNAFTPDESSPVPSREDSGQQSPEDNGQRLDALIELLVEKGLITRAEVAGRIKNN